MLRIKIWPLLLLMLSASCGINGQGTSDFCDKNTPIYADEQDIISGGTARQINAYDDYGQKKCGWKNAS